MIDSLICERIKHESCGDSKTAAETAKEIEKLHQRK